MKELKVNQTSDLLAFPYNTQENLDRSDAGTLVGSVGSNGELAYLARGSSIEVVKIIDGSRRSACNLGAIRNNVIIRCVNEFVVGDSRKLLLGLEVIGWKKHGLICVYDISMSKVVRAIWIPQAVTVMAVIDNITEFDSDLATFSNEQSKHLVVVGCKGGEILLVRIGKITSYEYKNDLSFPAELEKINLTSLSNTGSVKMKSSVNYGIYLSVDSDNDASFRYLDPTGKILKVFKEEQVAVSSLLPMKQASLLAVGYSFGCFHIWDLQSLQPIFSSSYSPSLADITHLVFQEPENDPRYCCYLMVGRSPSGSSDMNLPTTMTLHQLVFEIKETSEAGYYIYRDLEAVCKRFDHQLTSDSNHLADLVSIGSRIVAFSTLARDSKQQRLDQSGGTNADVDGKLFDTTLSYIVWESPPQDPEESHPSYHLGLFDINRWYQLQMPSSIGYAMYGSSDPVCPFFAFYSLCEVSEVILPDSLVDCFINAKNISCFSSAIYPTLEQNFWPSALAFKCTCLAERGIVKTEMLGMQRQILADLVAQGSEVFSHGYQLINLCWSAGLIPKLEVSRLDDPQIQFDCLMTVAMEHNIMGFILGCVRDWSRGEITNAGSCLRSVLQWTWKRVIKAKGILDEHYIQLFYSETSKIDDDVIRNLSNCAEELKRLVQILSALKESPVSTTDEGTSNLAMKLTVTDCIQRYADAILFFLRFEILPESTESRQVNLKSPFDEGTLFIDEYCNVIEEKIRDNGNDDDFGWNGQYPPPSVNVVCKSLLLDIPRDELINFFYYWILDAAEYLNLKKLPESASYFFNISKTKKNVIEAVWDIDHNHLESGVEKLIEFGPEVLPEAMKAVYRFGNKSLACGIYKAKEMISPGDSDWKLCIRILVENMSLYEAYSLQAKYRESEIGFELFQYFLEQCIKNNLMPKLFDLYLTDEDEDLVYQFLESKQTQVSKELLVIFCIKRHRYAEALKHGACFENQRWTYTDKSLFGGIPSRRAIFHMSNEIILPMQRKLISCSSVQSDKQITHGPEPAPLSSTIVKKPSFDDVTHTGTILSVLSSIGANRSKSELVTFDEPYNLPFVRSARSPIGRKRREYIKKQVPTFALSAKPEKKSILKPALSGTIKSEVPVKRRKHLFYGPEAMKLLQTPPVIRNPKHLKQARNIRTPASILKSSRVATKRDGTEKSMRKRVVISDPTFSVSPVQLSESPSKLPDSSSCLTPEVLRQEAMLESQSAVKEGANEASTDNPTEEIKKSLDFEIRDKNGDGSKPSSPEKEILIISKQDKADSVQHSRGAANLSTDSFLEKDVAVVDTTGLKEAEIHAAFGNESSLSSGYQATEIKIQDNSEYDVENLKDIEQGKVTPEKAEISVQDEVKVDQICNVKEDICNRGAILFTNEPMDNSLVRFMDSQDVTLDYYEERHGVLLSENPAGPSIASELLAIEVAEELQVEDDESKIHSQTQDDSYKLHEQSESLNEAGQTTVNEPVDEFSLQLDTDSNDFIDQGMAPMVGTEKQDLPLFGVVVESENKEVIGMKDIEKYIRENLETELGNESEGEKGKDASSKKETDEVEDGASDNLMGGKKEGRDNKEIMIDEVEEREVEQLMKQLEREEYEAEIWEKPGVLEEKYESPERNEQKETEILSEVGRELEFRKEVENEKEIKAEGEINSPLEAEGFELVQHSDRIEENYELAPSRTESDLSSKDKSRIVDSEMQFIIPIDPNASEEADKQPLIGLDLRPGLRSSINMNIPMSDVSTPHTYLGSADTNLSGHFSDLGTPDDKLSSNIGTTNGIDLRSRHIPAVGGALKELSNKTRGNLKVIVGKTDVTSEMGCLDSSFESQENSSFSRPLFMYNNPLVFENLTQERGATPPKQARNSDTTDTNRKIKAKGKKTGSSLPSPVKKRSSYSPSKSRRRPSFATPRKSPHDISYTPPVTRSSAKKGTTPVSRSSAKKGTTPVTRSSAKNGTTPVTRSSAKKGTTSVTRSSAEKITPIPRFSTRKNTSPFSRSAMKGTPSANQLREIEENALFSSSISESPISFEPVTDSGKKRLRNRSRRYSFQSPSTSNHSMTLRNRNKSRGLDMK